MNALRDNITADYGEDSFELVAIPTNNFGLQEPGSNAEIPLGLEYVRPGGGFVPRYKLTQKNNANGVDEDPLFTYLKDACPGTGEFIGDPTAMYWNPIRMHDLTWNFEKFIIDPEGKPVKRFSPPETPENLYDDIVALMPDRFKQRRLAKQQAIKEVEPPTLNKVIKEKLPLELYKEPLPHKKPVRKNQKKKPNRNTIFRKLVKSKLHRF